jgi:hypothetical protein
MTAVALAAGSPALGTPALIEVLSATSLLDSAPTFGTPRIGQVLVATAFADAAPFFGAALLNPIFAVPLRTAGPVCDVIPLFAVATGTGQFTVSGPNVIQLFPVLGDVVYTWAPLSQRTG